MWCCGESVDELTPQLNSPIGLDLELKDAPEGPRRLVPVVPGASKLQGPL